MTGVCTRVCVFVCLFVCVCVCVPEHVLVGVIRVAIY